MPNYAVILREQDGSSVHKELENDLTLDEAKDKAAAWYQGIDHGSTVEIVELFDSREVQICSMTLHAGEPRWECLDPAPATPVTALTSADSRQFFDPE